MGKNRNPFEIPDGASESVVGALVDLKQAAEALEEAAGYILDGDTGGAIHFMDDAISFIDDVRAAANPAPARQHSKQITE